jgi:dsDNA-specific endonuclease/ATPase MutS2
MVGKKPVGKRGIFSRPRKTPAERVQGRLNRVNKRIWTASDRNRIASNLRDVLLDGEVPRHPDFRARHNEEIDRYQRVADSTQPRIDRLEAKARRLEEKKSKVGKKIKIKESNREKIKKGHWEA